jgi:FMN phosphatase YigB (HAD superfamily)
MIKPMLNTILSDYSFAEFGSFLATIKSLSNSLRKAKYIKIGYAENYVIDRITIIEEGCPDVVIEGEKLLQYTDFSPFNNPTIIGYLAQLDDMYNDCVAIDAKEWIDFIVQYTFPSLVINYGKNTLFDDEESLAECVAQALADYGASVTNRALDELFKLPDKIADRMNKYMCEEKSQTFGEAVDTTQQLIKRLIEKENSKLYKNIVEQEEKFLKSSILTIPQDFYARMKKLKSTKGKANLVDLYDSLISDYGFCGFLALLQGLLNCINQNFSFEEILKKLVEASLKGFTPLQMVKFLELLPSDKRIEVINKVDAVLKQNDIFNEFLGTFADQSNAIEIVTNQNYEDQKIYESDIALEEEANTQNQMHSQNQIYTVFKRILKAQTKKKNPLIVI